MTLLICPVRPGDSNEELRYALRSWETNLILPDGLELMIVGHCPSWLDPEHFVPGNEYKSVVLAVFDNVYKGAEAAVNLGEGDVVFMNDDFFCLDPVGALLPVRRRVTLAEHVAQFPGGAGLWWPQTLRLTASWLADQGYPSPDSYEVHRPFSAGAERMVWALDRWLAENPLGSTDSVPQWRTVYGVLNDVFAYPVADAKLGNRQSGIGTPWVSTSDQSWRTYAGAMRKRFQKPSRWER